MQMVLSLESVNVSSRKQLLADFPLVIQGFHSDNGSYINRQLWRSFYPGPGRQRLVESKWAWVRKIFGHGHICR